jgi:hypothetical protein
MNTQEEQLKDIQTQLKSLKDEIIDTRRRL